MASVVKVVFGLPQSHAGLAICIGLDTDAAVINP